MFRVPGRAWPDVPLPLEVPHMVAQAGHPRLVGPSGARPGAMQLWADGSCYPNPGPSGAGVVAVGPDGVVEWEWAEALGTGTNNTAELVAVLRALTYAGSGPRVVADLYTDSAYAIGVVALGWSARNNHELIAEIQEVWAKLRGVNFIKIRGHHDLKYNERADELAGWARKTGGVNSWTGR